MTTLPKQDPLAAPPQNQTQSVAEEASFQFHCHPGLPCFTKCCHDLDLALSPYDVVRLRQSLALSSLEFLARYAIIEFGLDDLYPKVYLAMIDDGRGSCPFVEATGCQVYHDRPGACRFYPVGRGVSLDENGEKRTQFITIHEDHCCGFAEDRTQTVHDWQNDQQTEEYNRFNDLLLPLLQPLKPLQAFQRLSSGEATLFIDTLYNLDLFKTTFSQNSSASILLPGDEPALLPYAINWLQQRWQSAR
jgi:Fe-S-cluster containining protein